MSVPREPMCQNCGFFRRLQSPHQAWGNCQANPPSIARVDGVWESEFPNTHIADVCGKHKFREVFNADKIIELQAAQNFLLEFEKHGFKKSPQGC